MYEDKSQIMLNYIEDYVDWYETFRQAEEASEYFLQKCEYLDDLPIDLQYILLETAKEKIFDKEKPLKRFLARIRKADTSGGPNK